MITKEKMGKLLKSARQGKALTQIRLARKTRVTRQQIFNYENGENYPSLEKLDGLINVLGIPSYKFFDDKDTVDIIDKVGKKFAKYNKILDIIEKDRELEDFLYYCAKNKEKLKGLKFTNILKKLAELTPAERKRILKFISG